MFENDVLSGDVFEQEVFGRSVFGGRVYSEAETAPRVITAAPAGLPAPTTGISGYGAIAMAPGAARPWMRPISFHGSPDGLGLVGGATPSPIDASGMVSLVSALQACFGTDKAMKCDCPAGSAGAIAAINAAKALPPEMLAMMKSEFMAQGFPPGTPECAKGQMQNILNGGQQPGGQQPGGQTPGGQQPGGQQPAPQKPVPPPPPPQKSLTEQPWFLPVVIGGGVLVAYLVASKQKRAPQGA